MFRFITRSSSKTNQADLWYEESCRFIGSGSPLRILNTLPGDVGNIHDWAALSILLQRTVAHPVPVYGDAAGRPPSRTKRGDSQGDRGWIVWDLSWVELELRSADPPMRIQPNPDVLAVRPGTLVSASISVNEEVIRSCQGLAGIAPDVTRMGIGWLWPQSRLHSQIRG
ncbi:hypothetical protein HRR86_001077 [Exophiala dermatitidis]|nr:hypothetical protein HRR79_003251 [Exophiala dermatitidis]KAJ4618870.1 hypothetical protein HRR85_001866 [Exophiala dermatitidis]KAJ4633599.1 hypothetical protein HRR86_001077 [Exophiala dermatitidis]